MKRGNLTIDPSRVSFPALLFLSSASVFAHLFSLPPLGMSNGKKIFVGGLNYQTTDEGFRAFFNKFGEVTDAVIMRFPGPNGERQSRGFGFITYREASAADAALAARLELDGRALECKVAVPKEPNPNNPIHLAQPPVRYAGSPFFSMPCQVPVRDACAFLMHFAFFFWISHARVPLWRSSVELAPLVNLS